MKIATLSIGDELLCGEVVDTNASHIAAKLYEAGARVQRHLTVGDDEDAIVAALKELASASDAVVVSGGLGPTADDLTAAAAARAAAVELELSQGALEHLASFTARLPGGLHHANQKQALIPQGSALIPNPVGTACGFSFTLGKAALYFLPGVPSEMERMLEETVLPALTQRSEGGAKRIVLKLFGISEAAAGARLEGCLDQDSPVQLAYCVKFPEIHLILRAEAQHGEALQKAAAAVRERLGSLVFAQDEETMDTLLCALLKKRGLTLALAESCTGGMIAARITAAPGSSAYFLEGAVTYSNQAKTRMLQVPAELIEQKGAVSAEVASAMAIGARRAAGSDLALSVTGIAGPDGGTPEKPVGTVFLALADADGCSVQGYHFLGDRAGVRSITCFTALDWLRNYLLDRRQA
jgi:nicotinamide-nucleotide amidase